MAQDTKRSISAFESESADAARTRSRETYSREQSEMRRLLAASSYNEARCCCWRISRGLKLWIIFMLVYNFITTGIFGIIIKLTYSEFEYEMLISYVIMQAILRFIMNIIGFKSVNHIFSKSELLRNNNFLFLFGVSSILFTIIFDSVFLIYFNYILYHISTDSTKVTDWVGSHDMIILIWFNVTWIIDMMVSLFSVREYYRYIGIDMRSEYYRYKMDFWLLMSLTILMFGYGIASVVITITRHSKDLF